MAERIKTNIKFYKGLDNIAGRTYGFVTKVKGSWKGCRETERKKKIVFVDTSIENTIVPNMLYKCTLIPMRTEDGFIAKTAVLVQFPGTISTVCRRNVFIVLVKFGNKVIIYDPSSKDKRKRDIKMIADNLRNRLDLEDGPRVAEDFIDNACMIKRLYDQSLENV